MNQHMSVAEYRKLNAQSVTAPIKITKKTKSSHNTCPTEYQEAVMFKHKLDEMIESGTVLLYAHIINEMSLNRNAGQKPNFAYLNKLKAEGWKVGVPDYIVILAPYAKEYKPEAKWYPGKIVFIELKRAKGGTVSPEQKAWIAAINQAGGYARVCRGCEEAKTYLNSLI